MVDHAADRLKPFLAGHLRIVIVGHEGVLAAAHVHVVFAHTRQIFFVIAAFYEVILTTAPEAHVVVTARGRHAHERLGHEAGKDAVLTRHLGTDLAIGGQTVGVAQHVIEHPVQFQLAGRILVVALDHVEAHLTGVFDHLHGDRAQRLELVDVVAIGLGIAVFRLAVLVEFQPHHLRLGADAQAAAMLLP